MVYNRTGLMGKGEIRGRVSGKVGEVEGSKGRKENLKNEGQVSKGGKVLNGRVG